jgi:hypothetical protein
VHSDEGSRQAVVLSGGGSQATTLPVILLWVTSLLFVAFGIGFVVAPRYFADLVTGSAPTVPSAVIDMRATYGGVALGLGLFFGVAARRATWLRPALVASLLVIACIGGARLVGIVADGEPNSFMLLLLATEVISVALFALAIRQVGSRTG